MSACLTSYMRNYYKEFLSSIIVGNVNIYIYMLLNFFFQIVIITMNFCLISSFLSGRVPVAEVMTSSASQAFVFPAKQKKLIMTLKLKIMNKFA